MILRWLLVLCLPLSPAIAQQGTMVGPLPSATGQAATGQIPGTATNDSAAAGKVGEYITNTLAQGSAISLTTNTATDITSVPLTAGDWNCWGQINFAANAATTVNFEIGAISAVSNTLPTNTDGFSQLQLAGATGINTNYLAIAPMRFLLSGTTTIYLVAYGTFLVNTLSAYGKIACRRAR